MFVRILKYIAIILGSLFVLSIFLPPFMGCRSRDKARQSSCTNNLKQLGIALTSYAADWDDSLPSSTRDKRKDGAAINASAWDEQIAKYIKSDGVYKCPSNSLKRYSVHQPLQKIAGKWVKTRIVSYAMNDQLLGVAPGDGPPTDRPMSQAHSTKYADLPNPGGTILISEMKGWDAAHRNKSGTGMAAAAEIHPSYHAVGPGLDENKWDIGWGVARDVHSGGCNSLFADNHVKWKRIETTMGRPARQAFVPLRGSYPGNEWMLRNTPQP